MENFIFDIIGTVAFALSGAFVALKKEMDVFGVVILALTTAVGGGMVRDIILGLTPPMALVNPVYSFVAMGTGALTFVYTKLEFQIGLHKTIADWMLNFTDAVGLGSFTVTGIAIAQNVSEGNWFLCLFVGVVTGIGGGILRDLFAGDIPFVFVKFFYASASLIGGIVCIAVWNWFVEWQCMLAGAVVTVALRVCAMCYHWKLPKCKKNI
ncbi:MAG: trimeric intracellular cation channel family protein [Phascolarctobacterium sp.]|nr:trimeric intracellular cation channel family protein [Candidatus Phascolarctobacterium caballi]MCQ2381490.1 trimeric intracellular cation channel family protein [Acidaminococcaceae bacterium]